MAAKVTLSGRIAAAPERVFSVFTDFVNAAENVRSIQKLELLTNGKIGVGTKFRETRTMFGKSATETMEITDFVPGRSYSVGCESCGAIYKMRFDFRPDGAGTNVDMEFGATPVKFFAKLMSPLSGLMMKACRKAMEQDFEDLKAVAEREA